MSPLIYKFGPLEIHAFTAWLALGVVIGTLIVLGSAARQHQRLMLWLDTVVGAVIGATIGARLAHVGLNWVYFAAHTDEILSFSSGGLDWHGALLGGLLGASLIAIIRRVPWLKLMDTFALVVPFGAMAIWLACAAANSAYGIEVRTLADFPTWLVIESPDVYGAIAPRLNLAPIGIALAVVVLVIIVGLTLLRWVPGLRLWLALIVYGIGMALIDFFRAEYVPTIMGRRADQVLDLAVVLLAALLFGIVGMAMLSRRRAVTAPAAS